MIRDTLKKGNVRRILIKHGLSYSDVDVAFLYYTNPANCAEKLRKCLYSRTEDYVPLDFNGAYPPKGLLLPEVPLTSTVMKEINDADVLPVNELLDRIRIAYSDAIVPWIMLANNSKPYQRCLDRLLLQMYPSYLFNSNGVSENCNFQIFGYPQAIRSNYGWDMKFGEFKSVITPAEVRSQDCTAFQPVNTLDKVYAVFIAYYPQPYMRAGNWLSTWGEPLPILPEKLPENEDPLFQLYRLSGKNYAKINAVPISEGRNSYRYQYKWGNTISEDRELQNRYGLYKISGSNKELVLAANCLLEHVQIFSAPVIEPIRYEHPNETEVSDFTQTPLDWIIDGVPTTEETDETEDIKIKTLPKITGTLETGTVVSAFQNNIWGGHSYIDYLLNDKAYPLSSKLQQRKWIPNFSVSSTNETNTVNPAISYGMNGYYNEFTGEWYDYTGYPTSPKFVRTLATLKTPQVLSGLLIVNAALGNRYAYLKGQGQYADSLQDADTYTASYPRIRCTSVLNTYNANNGNQTFDFVDLYSQYNLPKTLLISGKTDSKFQTQWKTLLEFEIDYTMNRWYQWETISDITKYKQIMISVLGWRRDTDTRDVSLWKNCYIPPIVLFGR